MSKRKRTITTYRIDNRRYTIIISTRANGTISHSTNWREIKSRHSRLTLARARHTVPAFLLRHTGAVLPDNPVRGITFALTACAGFWIVVFTAVYLLTI